jgi:hypothetical protein
MTTETKAASPDSRSAGATTAASRRQFLQGAAALGLTALARRFLSTPARAVTPPAQPAPPHSAYLPLVIRQGPAARGPSKLGLHTLRPDGAVTFVQAVHDAGAHVALVKALDEFGYLRQVKTISPETITVGRSTVLQGIAPTGSPADVARTVMAQHMPRWQYEKDVVDYWEVLNECRPPTMAGHVWLAQFFIAAMEIAEQNDYRLAIFSYSTGVPQWHDWEAIVETSVFARARAGGHVLALHEYDWPVIAQRWGEPTEDLPPQEDRGGLAARYRYLYRDFLIPRGEVTPLVITECGLDPVVGGPPGDGPWQQRYVQEMAWYDTKLREDDYVLGAAMFSIGTFDQWERYDYGALLWPGNPYGANFLDYIASLKDA